MATKILNKTNIPNIPNITERTLGGGDFTQVILYYDEYYNILKENMASDIISIVSEYLPYACSVIWMGKLAGGRTRLKNLFISNPCEIALLSQHPKFLHFLFANEKALENVTMENILNIICKKGLVQSLKNIYRNPFIVTNTLSNITIKGTNILDINTAKLCLELFRTAKINYIDLLDGAIETNNTPLFSYLISVFRNSVDHYIVSKKKKQIYKIADPEMLKLLFRSGPFFKRQIYNLDEIISNAADIKIVHTWYYELGIKKENFTYSNSCINYCRSEEILDFLFLILNSNFCYTEVAIDFANENSNLKVLNWWMTKFKAGELELKYTKKIILNSDSKVLNLWNENNIYF